MEELYVLKGYCAFSLEFEDVTFGLVNFDVLFVAGEFADFGS